MVPERINLAVIPGGALGKAFAGLAAEQGHRVAVWCHSRESLEEYQPSSKNIRVTGNMKEALLGAQVIFLAPPAKNFRGVFREVYSFSGSAFSATETLYLSGSKGLEKGTCYTPTQVILNEQPRLVDRIAAMSGPNLAKEMMRHDNLGTVISSYTADTAKYLQTEFQSKYFRVYTEPDVVGTEAAGALKNIFALGAGMGNALGVSPGTMALYMTRSLAEMTKLGMALGAQDRSTFMSLAGIGDLYLSCAKGATRNEEAGEELASGKTREELLASRKLIEGLYTVDVAVVLGRKHGIEIPITEGIYGVVHGDFDVREGIERLMGRQPSEEQLGGRAWPFRLARLGQRILCYAGFSPLPNHGNVN